MLSLDVHCPAWMYRWTSKLGHVHPRGRHSLDACCPAWGTLPSLDVLVRFQAGQHPSKLGLQVGWMSASLDTPYHLIWNFWLGCRTELQQVGACPTRPGFFIETLFNSRRVLRILCVMTFLLECYPKRNQIISSTSRIGSLYFDLLE